ncbi:hypothetical protein Vadar_003342 [Vaccinium darrowii]|uniref:Uncharacterized protein n=1 Tax=Vaccinium darrowii TaxID=229202 RepID=A0ACB7X7P9_9ERIC|nr:hypothetical protein Vadar_003342 [Vaccinium darrowii]
MGMVVTLRHHHHTVVVVGDRRPEIGREELHHVLAGECFESSLRCVEWCRHRAPSRFGHTVHRRQTLNRSTSIATEKPNE